MLRNKVLILYYGTKYDGRNRNVNKTHLHANSLGLPQYITKTHGTCSHNIFVDHCCDITERSEIDVWIASSAIRQGRLSIPVLRRVVPSCQIVLAP